MEPHAQLTAAFKEAPCRCQSLGTAASSSDYRRPYVEQVQQPLDVLFIEDVIALPVSIGAEPAVCRTGSLLKHNKSLTNWREPRWAMQTILEGWVRHLADNFSSINGSTCLTSSDPIRISRAVE